MSRGTFNSFWLEKSSGNRGFESQASSSACLSAGAFDDLLGASSGNRGFESQAPSPVCLSAGAFDDLLGASSCTPELGEVNFDPSSSTSRTDGDSVS
jgi:hypothetical protein